MSAGTTRVFVIMYIVGITILSVLTTLLQVPPASWLIEAFASPTDGTFSPNIVIVLLLLIGLVPLFAVLTVARWLRIRKPQVVAPNEPGFWVTRKKTFQSAMVGIPVWINGKEAGIVDNGQQRFFPLPPGTYQVKAGIGRQASPPLTVTIAPLSQVHLLTEIKADLFSAKVLLAPSPGQSWIKPN